jgi:tetratricopeptide (TPR) repeat protein
LSTQEDGTLTEAIAAVRAGDHTRARDLLGSLLKVDSANPEYWLWMSAVVESERERIYCLQSVLRHDPTNRAALRGLTILGEHVPEKDEITASLDIPHRKIIRPTRVSPTGLPMEHAWKIIGGAAAGLVLLVVVVSLLLRPGATGVAPTLAPPTPTFTPVPPTPTLTPVPINSVFIRTPIPTNIAGTPIGYLLAITPTPTPLIGITPRPIYEAYTSAVNAIQRGDFNGSIQYIEQVIDLDPNLADAYYLLGESYRLLGRLNEALDAYRQALDLNPIMAAAYLGIGRIQLTWNPGILPDSINLAISYDPALLPAYLIKAEILSNNRNWQALAETAQTALDAGTNTPMLYLYLGEAQFQLGEYDLALKSILRATADDPTILKAYGLLGYILTELGRYEDSISPLMTHVSYNPNDYLAWSYLGHAYYSSGDPTGAEMAFDRSLELNPGDVNAYHLRGLLRLEQGRYEEAFADLREAQQRGISSIDVLHGIARASYELGYHGITLETINLIIQTSSDIVILTEVFTLQATIFEAQDPPLYEEALIAWQSILGLGEIPEEVRSQAQIKTYTLQAWIAEAQDPPLYDEALIAWQALLELEGLPEEIRNEVEEEIVRISDILFEKTPTPSPLQP